MFLRWNQSAEFQCCVRPGDPVTRQVKGQLIESRRPKPSISGRHTQGNIACKHRPFLTQHASTSSPGPELIHRKEVPYLTRCHLEYIIEIFSRASTPIEKQHLQAGRSTVTQLTPFTNYTYRVSTKNTVTGKVSSTGRFEARTNPTGDFDGVRHFYRYNYNMKPISCPGGRSFLGKNTTDNSTKISVCPYCKIILEVQAGNEEGISDMETTDFETEAARPTSRVRATHCSPTACSASLTDGCDTYNGPDMAIEYTFLPEGSERQRCHEKTFNGSQTSRRVPLGEVLDLDSLKENLLPYTTYRVRALSLTLNWDEPEDCPPTGEIKEYEISWKKNGGSYQRVKTTNTEYVIGNLETDTKYVVTVGSEVTHTRQENTNITPLLVSVILAKFEGLMPGRQYNLTVNVCNRRMCSDSVWTLNWTVPESPSVHGTLTWISNQPSSTTVYLPYILRKSSVDVHNKQYVMVREDEGDTAKWGDAEYLISLAKGWDKQRDISDVEWISAVLEDDEVARAPDVRFIIGDNTTRHGVHNHPIESDKCYLVAVVSVATAGPHERYHVSDAKPLCNGPRPILVAVGIIFGIVLLLALTAVALQLRYGKQISQKNISVAAVENSNGPIGNAEPSRGFEIPAQTKPLLVRQESTEFMSSLEPKEEYTHRESHIYENLGRKISQEHLEAYLARAINSQDIDFEFKSVPVSMPKSCSYGERMENKRKNRYRNNLPYDDTRIELPMLPDQPFSDYINASLIQGHVEGTDYIATQGPKDYRNDTVSDFWRMVWHCRSNIIIMVANLVENGQVKVAQYWPEKQPVFCGGLQVTLVEVEVKVEYIIRRMLVTYQNEVRKVTQYQYIAWPDHGVPHNPFGLALMVSAIREQEAEGPTSRPLQRRHRTHGHDSLRLPRPRPDSDLGYLDGLEVLLQLRNGRPRLIENTIQYNFGHRILQEFLFGINTSFACGDFPKELSRLRETDTEDGASVLEMQYKKLKNLPKVLSFIMAKNPACASLNRNPDILPADNRMVFVQSLGGGLENQYVNAVRLNSLDRKDAYIAAEYPQQHTMQSIWALVYERRIPVWVLMQTFPENDQEYPSVIPALERQQVGQFLLTLTGLQSYQNFVEYYIEIAVQGSRMASPHMCVLGRNERLAARPGPPILSGASLAVAGNDAVIHFTRPPLPYAVLLPHTCRIPLQLFDQMDKGGCSAKADARQPRCGRLGAAPSKKVEKGPRKDAGEKE
nr:receptor-type tyrosine-protein phosphatase T-like [Penaeus vannamei]